MLSGWVKLENIYKVQSVGAVTVYRVVGIVIYDNRLSNFRQKLEEDSGIGVRKGLVDFFKTFHSLPHFQPKQPHLLKERGIVTLCHEVIGVEDSTCLLPQ